ncbi:MAG: EAL domain-containing protein, partial [Chloroflexota bacterium]|nr:EAL domain-containing protein [Chloroflexota bacterium]
LEVTETALIADLGAASTVLDKLRALGVRLALDDFGTGYSSLAYLKRFPVDALKIDRAFVDGLGHDAQDTAIVRSVITIAKSLDLAVTGEGVETVEQLAQLRALNCDEVQGYYFARPQVGEAVDHMIELGFAELAEAALPRAA